MLLSGMEPDLFICYGVLHEEHQIFKRIKPTLSPIALGHNPKMSS